MRLASTAPSRGGPSPRSRAGPGRSRRYLLLLVGGAARPDGVRRRLVYLQGLDASALAQTAQTKRLTTVTIPGDRGEILDANGAVLATSVEKYDIDANPKTVATWKGGADSAAEAAALLAPLLGASRARARRQADR